MDPMNEEKDKVTQLMDLVRISNASGAIEKLEIVTQVYTMDEEIVRKKYRLRNGNLPSYRLEALIYEFFFKTFKRPGITQLGAACTKKRSWEPLQRFLECDELRHQLLENIKNDATFYDEEGEDLSDVEIDVDTVCSPTSYPEPPPMEADDHPELSPLEADDHPELSPLEADDHPELSPLEADDHTEPPPMEADEREISIETAPKRRYPLRTVPPPDDDEIKSMATTSKRGTIQHREEFYPEIAGSSANMGTVSNRRGRNPWPKAPTPENDEVQIKKEVFDPTYDGKRIKEELLLPEDNGVTVKEELIEPDVQAYIPAKRGRKKKIEPGDKDYKPKYEPKRHVPVPTYYLYETRKGKARCENCNNFMEEEGGVRYCLFCMAENL